MGVLSKILDLGCESHRTSPRDDDPQTGINLYFRLCYRSLGINCFIFTSRNGGCGKVMFSGPSEGWYLWYQFPSGWVYQGLGITEGWVYQRGGYTRGLGIPGGGRIYQGWIYQ